MGLDAGAWSAYQHDPRDPVHAHLRVGDADRVTTLHLLGEAYAEGRLDLEEHDERATAAQSARVLGDLVPLLDDLVPRLSPPQGRELARATPGELRTRAEQQWREERRQALLGFLGPTLICWTVYGAIVLGESPGDWHFPWPLIVTVVTLLNLLRVQLGHTEIVADRLSGLERKQAKALAKEQTRAARLDAPVERLDPEAVRAASELARRKAREAARSVEQDVVRRFNEKFKPPGPSGPA